MRRLSSGLQFLILLFILVLGLVLIAFLVLNNTPREEYESPSNENQKVVDITDEIHKDFNNELTIKHNQQDNNKITNDNSKQSPSVSNISSDNNNSTIQDKNVDSNNVEELDPTSALDRITTEYTDDNTDHKKQKKVIDPVNYDHKSGFDNLF